MEVIRKTFSIYPEDWEDRLTWLANRLFFGKKQPDSITIRVALAVTKIVVARNNGQLPDDIVEELPEKIRRALEEENER